MAAPFTLPLLPYEQNALEPVISGRTIGLHYHKHHGTYVDTLNTLVKGTRYAEMPLAEIVRATLNAPEDSEQKIFNNAGQVWNHDFYWRSLSPKGTKPSGELKNAIARDFGTADALIGELAKAGKEQFGSGWVWLVSKDGKLCVEKTSNAADPMARCVNCLLTVDVWEHAYYLDYQNERPRYIEGVLSKLLNWDFASENLTKEPAEPMRSHWARSRFEIAMQDVGKVFAYPQDIVNSSALTLQQKIDLLKEWELDLRQLMVASEENMPSNAPGQAAELLRSVRLLLTRLGAPEHEPAVANKAGG